MRVELCEDISLEKIMDSGQCFRVSKIESGDREELYRFISGDRLLYATQLSDRELELSCNEEEWQETWSPYFDMDESYTELCMQADPRDEYLQASIEFGKGIRVLRQEPFEMLISFILSQRKSIPAIKSSIEKLCEAGGEIIDDRNGIVYGFPDAERITELSDEQLRSCGLGYRAPYVRDAAERVLSGELVLSELFMLSDDELFERLTTVRGVGKKVANCIMLFAYHRIERVPEDVWVNRIIENKYNGVNPFPGYKKAGIIQQYMFYYALKHKSEMG